MPFFADDPRLGWILVHHEKLDEAGFEWTPKGYFWIGWDEGELATKTL